MKYEVQLSEAAKKSLKKINKHQSQIIVSWIERNLDGCENPRQHGAALSENLKGFWKYRIGAYRLIADIQDEIVLIEIVHVGHRREVYKQ